VGSAAGNRNVRIRTLVRLWLGAAHVFLLTVAAVLASRYPTRAVVLLLLVPIAFTPFAYARLRVLDRCIAIVSAHARSRSALIALAVVGCVADAVTLTQLLTARSPVDLPLVHAPGITWVGPVWFSTHVLWLAGHLISAGAVAIGGRTRRVLDWLIATPPDGLPASPERRVALQQIGLLGVGAPFAVSLSGVSMSYDFRVDEHEIVIPNWPRALDGLRVAHLSDIHVGGAMNRERLLRIAALTNEARPDLVIHTGDFLTHRSSDFDAPLYEALAQISADLGQWACLGNHDYDNPERLVRQLRDAGVRTLRNALATLALNGTELEVAGLDFARARSADIFARMMAGWRARDGHARLLLNHDPSGFASLPQGCADLVCSGHTHGGHVGVQLGKSALTVVGMIGIPDQGLFERGAMRLFVTRCVGFYGYPIRLGIPPEIALLTLRAA
jgi:predicted MPP superfamily phosphohydrolase